ncbi:MAG: hypothetical protein ABI355_11095 [Solirubrobacteraceae bacterium]
MTNHIRSSARAGLALALAGVALAVALGAAAALAAPRASSRPAPVTIASAHSSLLHETILVTSGSGRTLYHLKPESARHILCTSACAKLWPPLLVRSRQVQLKAGAGVHGHLSIVARPDGRLQAAFDGMPLYTFARDHRRGDANGQGFLHVWFVLPTGQSRTGPPGARHGQPDPAAQRRRHGRR